jgi:hypothetical protein
MQVAFPVVHLSGMGNRERPVRAKSTAKQLVTRSRGDDDDDLGATVMP